MYQIGITPLKLIYSSSVFLVDLICCSFLIFMSKWFVDPKRYSLISCFSAGVLISAAFIQLLGEAEKNPSIDTDGPTKGFPIVHFLCALGFIVTMLVQQIMLAIGSKMNQRKITLDTMTLSDGLLLNTISTQGEESQEDTMASNTDANIQTSMRNMRIVAIMFFGVTVSEGLVSGITLGLQQNKANVSTMFLAIISHDWLENMICQFNFLNSVSKSTLNKKRTKFGFFVLSMLSSSINIIGVSIGLLLYYNLDPNLLEKMGSGSIAFTSGCFFYIATVEMISKELPDSANFMGFRIELRESPINTKRISKARSIIQKLLCTTIGFALSSSISYVFSRE